MYAIPVLTDVVEQDVVEQIVVEQIVDKRKEHRALTIGRALMQVIDAHDSTLIGKAFHADVINTSASGVRVCAEQISDLIDGATFEMWIGINGRDQKLYLKGDLRWVSWEESNEFHMGIEILDRMNTDSLEWRNVHLQ